MLCQQVKEFSVEPPLDDLSLDEAPYVLAPSCCSLDPAAPGSEVEEENGEEVFLSAYDDLSPLLEPKPTSWEGLRNLKEEAGGCGRPQTPIWVEEEQASWEAKENKQVEFGSTSVNKEVAKASLDPELEVGAVTEEGGEAGGSQEMTVNFEEGSSEVTESKGEKQGQETESTEEAKDVEQTRGEQNKDMEKEREIEGQEAAEKGEEIPAEAGIDPDHGVQKQLDSEEVWEVVPNQEAEGGRNEEVKGRGEDSDHKARKDQDHGGDGRGSETAGTRGEGEVSKEQESAGGETVDKRADSDHLEEGALSEGSGVESLEIDSVEGVNTQSSETDQASPQLSESERMEPEVQFVPEGCNLCPCHFASAGGVGMRLASTLVQVQQARSVPVVPPKPQFAKMPSAMSSKIHVAPASPCPRPGRLDGTPGERVWASHASRSSWRNGGSLSFDAAVALARERQRTEAQGIRRTQTCTGGGGDYNFNPRMSPCNMNLAPPRPLSYLELPPEGTEGSEPRNRLSLPARESHPPIPLMSPQRRSYAFETQANLGKGEGL